MDITINILIALGLGVVIYILLKKNPKSPVNDGLNQERQKELEEVTKRLKDQIAKTSADKRKEDDVEKYYNDNN